MYLSIKFKQVLSIVQKFGHGFCHGTDFADGFFGCLVIYFGRSPLKKLHATAEYGDAALFLQLGAIRTL